MNQKQLEYFLKVYETGSISKAAQQLFLSPQGLRKTILSLERELGLELFDRTGRRMRPTDAGTWLREHARLILEEYDLIAQKRYLEEGPRKTLRLFYTYGVMDYLTVEFIRRFQEKYPQILLSLAEIPDPVALERLRTGEGELALLSDPVDVTYFSVKQLYTCNYCVVLHESHPLAKKKTLCNGDLRGYPMIVKGREFNLYHTQWTRSSRQDQAPYVALETTSYHLAHRMAAANLGIGFTLDYLAQQDPLPHTVVRPLDEENMQKVISLVQRRNLPLSPEAEALKQFLLDWVKEMEEDPT